MKFKWSHLKKQYQITVIVAIVVVLLAGGTLGAYAYCNHQAELERQAYEQAVMDQNAQLDKQASQLTKIQKSAEALLDESYLVATVTDEDIKTLEDQLAGIEMIIVEDKYTADLQEQLDTNTAKKKEAKELLETIRTKYDKQAAVNSLFLEPALVGDKVKQDPIIADKLDSKAVTTAKEKHYHEDSEEKWQQSINGLLDAAEKQIKQIDKLKAQLAKYLKDGVITDEVTPDTIASLKKEVEKVKNETIKAQLLDESVKIELLYDEKVKAAAEAKAAEVGGTAEKQGDGSYKIVADEGEYNISTSGEVTQVAAPSGGGSSGGSNSGSGTGSGNSNNGSGGSAGGSSGDSGSTGAPAPQPEPEPAAPAPQPEPAPEPEPVYEEPYIVQGQIYDGLFDTAEELDAYAAKLMEEGVWIENEWNGYWGMRVVYSNGITKYTIKWY